jgi:hypothetical protein
VAMGGPGIQVLTQACGVVCGAGALARQLLIQTRTYGFLSGPRYRARLPTEGVAGEGARATFSHALSPAVPSAFQGLTLWRVRGL